MKWILHVDMNCYFASVEQQDNPSLRGRPVGVGGKPGTRSIIASASREAKALGVQTAMPAHEALRVCPQLVIVPPDYPKYQRTSERMFGILETISPDLEIFSIDEAFLEVTHPQISTQINADTDQRESVNRSADVSPLINLVHAIKDRLRRELGDVLTASVGVARSKRLAKLASESQKPDGLTVLLGDDEASLVGQFRSHGVRAFTRAELYEQTDIEALAGIGPRLGRRLRATGIQTLADLATRTLDELHGLVFPYHRELFLIGRGHDPAPVIPYWRAKPEQSIGHQYTLPKDVPVIELPATLAWLAERVGRRLRTGGWVAQSLSLYLGRTHAPGWGAHQMTTTYLASDRDLYQLAWTLIRTAADHPASPLDWMTPIRRPGLTVSRLTPRSGSPSSFFLVDRRQERITECLDDIRDRFGDQSITSGLAVGVHHHEVPDGRRKRFTPQPVAGSS